MTFTTQAKETIAIALIWTLALLVGFFGIRFAISIAPKTVCQENVLLVERRFGFDRPVDKYENTQGLPTYRTTYCVKKYND